MNKLYKFLSWLKKEPRCIPLTIYIEPKILHALEDKARSQGKHRDVLLNELLTSLFTEIKTEP